MNIDRKSFERRYKNTLEFIQRSLDIELNILEKASIKEILRYVFEDLNSRYMGEEYYRNKWTNPQPSIEVLTIFLRQYGIHPLDVLHNYNQDWFKKEVRKRRELSLML